NITYKILYNDAVAMTGGQPVDGPISVHTIAQTVRAEGVERIALVSDEPELFDAGDFPAGLTISHRRDMDEVQRELRDIEGVTVLIYAQTCATEKRRRRKRGTLVDPRKFVVINELVCEGCGDCSVESNCLSVIPKETPFGRKRQIDQNTCNKDYSCVNGFCPSFVTVEGDVARQVSAGPTSPVPMPAIDEMPQPQIPATGSCYDLLVTGVGGTGVVTIGALITMAAHVEGKGASVLDFMGFAQKFGPVLSYIRIAPLPSDINQVRIETARADALIGCDLVVSSSPKASRTYGKNHTRAVVNTAEMLTADFVKHRDANLRVNDRIGAISDAIGADNLSTLNANKLANELLGDTIYANVLLLGFAWQSGLVPVSLLALMRAIELNAVAVEKNKLAFSWGRMAAIEPDRITHVLNRGSVDDETLTAVVARRRSFLAEYQNEALAVRFEERVESVRCLEATVGGQGELADAVARTYFKLLSYKDEYEVARLHTSKEFIDSVRSEFGAKAKFRFHLAPPILNSGRDARGRPRKKEFGAWILPVFRMLAKFRGLRGTAFDIFGRTTERRMERALIKEFELLLEDILPTLQAGDLQGTTDLVTLYMNIRGYGPVKEESVERVRRQVAESLHNLRRETAAAA
ncbi:MAG: indolepyruvate ferredoxin oxidoreductase family protein, partial [Woeseiaceae bacterium]|nr:indolepyruvate ferredoxin oxidoreductase family protein [Woeseiaceae bacterium]